MFVEHPSQELNQYADLLYGLTTLSPKRDGHGNMALRRGGDDPRNDLAALHNRLALCQEFGNPIYSVLAKPADSTQVRRVTELQARANSCLDSSKFGTCDGLLTGSRGLMMAVLVADAQPIILFDPDIPAVAIVRAGWKNTLGGPNGTIVTTAVRSFRTQFGSPPRRLVAYLGPTICAEHYTRPTTDLLPIIEFYRKHHVAPFRFQRGTTLHCGIGETNRRLLESLGVETIDVDGRCTYEHPRLASARRDDPRLGGPYRDMMAMAVMIKPK